MEIWCDKCDSEIPQGKVRYCYECVTALRELVGEMVELLKRGSMEDYCHECKGTATDIKTDCDGGRLCKKHGILLCWYPDTTEWDKEIKSLTQRAEKILEDSIPGRK